ncbi:hypothetical protein [Collimonas fungivorans]|uniref:Uncharacterized protein n=1 Tax=Collimonas fungivorans (strain Ter331) TaxID=1005048 RepID=G0AFP1_COLFT|nr:hypothetical protein [Collimonas fungivorans]AEK64130.1 hypothetical protein CFU_4309 [Collimonas fungivorans Ter331]
MQSGKIGDPHVPVPSEPVIAEQKESGANAGQRSGARGRQRTGLPMVAEGLPRPSAHQAQTRPASSGRSRRSGTLPPAPAAASHGAVSAGEHEIAVDKALKYGVTWQGLVNGSMTQVSQRLRLAESGVKSADSGLAGLEGLKGKIADDQYQGAKGALHVRRAQSAEYGISTSSDQVAQWSWNGAQGSASDDGGEQIGTQEELTAMDRALAELQGFREVVVKHGGVLREFVRQCEQPAAPENMLIQLSAIKSGAAAGRKTLLEIAGKAITVNVDRLVMLCLRSGGMASMHLMPRVMELLNAISKRSSDTEQAIRILERGDELSPAKRTEYQALAAAYADQLNAAGELFCLDAASTLEMSDNSGIWQHSLEMAHAISAYQACLREVCEPDDSATPSSALPEAMPEYSASSSAHMPASSTSTSAPERTDKAASGKVRKSHGRGKQLQKQAVPRPLPAVALVSHAKVNTVVSAPPAEILAQSPPLALHDGLQGKIERTLRKYPIDLDVAKSLGGDVIAIARSIEKNTRGIEMLNGPKDDPMIAADFVRSSAQNWFGDIGRLRATSDEARKSPVIDKATVELLGSRLQALEIIHQGMDVREGDALKVHKFPKGKHVSRLLQLGQIESVRPPVQLPSDKDTLYEIRIQPKPLSSGERAPPVFLHLHSDKYVPSEEVLKLPLRGFTATHLKTNEQKNLGPKHEAMSRALHKYDEKIHRGTVTSALLDELRDWLHA